MRFFGKKSKKREGRGFEDDVDLDANPTDQRKRSLTSKDKKKKKKRKKKDSMMPALVDPDSVPLDARSSVSVGSASIAMGEFTMDGTILSFTHYEAAGGGGASSDGSSVWSTASNASSAVTSVTDDASHQRQRRGRGRGKRVGLPPIVEKDSPSSGRYLPSKLRAVGEGVKHQSAHLRDELKRDISIAGETVAAAARVPMNFLRKQSLYMRTADLAGLDRNSVHSKLTENGVAQSDMVGHYHTPSVEPPHSGVEADPKEAWVALDTGSGDHSPVAPFAVEALAQWGYEVAMNRDMWTPDRSTAKVLKKDVWAEAVWRERGPIPVPGKGTADAADVMVWSGGFKHGFYGSDLPTVRAEGVVDMSPLAVVELLLDSDRVHEYNKMSLGRKDLLVLSDDLTKDGPFGRSVTKVVRAETKPPLVRKALQFTTLIHARQLEDGAGYLIVSRAVTQDEGSGADAKVMKSEILMGVNVVRAVEGDEGRCIMININHIRSPMIPMMVAKKIGLSAATGFFGDMRALC